RLRLRPGGALGVDERRREHRVADVAEQPERVVGAAELAGPLEDPDVPGLGAVRLAGIEPAAPVPRRAAGHRVVAQLRLQLVRRRVDPRLPAPELPLVAVLATQG